MHAIEHTYQHLLADVRQVSGSLLKRSADYDLTWLINDAPKLEKELLHCIEEDFSPDACEQVMANSPYWLRDLIADFMRSKNAWHLKQIRQLLLFCYKAEHTYSDDHEQKAYQAWCTVNRSTRDWSESYNSLTNSVVGRAQQLIHSIIGNVEWREITPSHGPGAVYQSNAAPYKARWTRWYPTIESLYPYHEYFCTSMDATGYPGSGIDWTVSDQIRAKVICVPKDARGPRTICVHPAEAIWIQQGLRRKLEHAIKTCSCGISPKGRINFDDQTVNQRLALEASCNDSYATLDLKEASDRLSDRLVQRLFGRSYRWFGSCRATYADLPRMRSDFQNEQIISAYAPMGNATVFPVQSLVFWALCVSTLEIVRFHQPSDCYVFGDDIIVPRSLAPIIIEVLESVGLVVNRAKSFYKGNFRESCGVDAFNGFDVTPIRWKTTYDVSSLESALSLSSLGQRLRVAGYEEAAMATYRSLSTYMRNVHGAVLNYTNNVDHGSIAEYTTLDSRAWQESRWDSCLHRWTTPCFRVVTPAVPVEHDWCHVLDSLAVLERSRSADLSPSAKLRRTRLVRDWAPVI